MDQKQETKVSKFLSFVLRHSPQDIDLELDAQGWANVDELIEKAKEHQNFSFQELLQVVRNNEKQRFLLSDDLKRIKANQGHTIQVELGLKDVEPPIYLYHGTATRFIAQIRSEGLKPMSRHDVHLSFNEEVAKKVGERHGVPFILKIKAKQMFDEGCSFQCTPNNVWLTQKVEPKYFEN